MLPSINITVSHSNVLITAPCDITPEVCLEHWWSEWWASISLQNWNSILVILYGHSIIIILLWFIDELITILFIIIILWNWIKLLFFKTILHQLSILPGCTTLKSSTASIKYFDIFWNMIAELSANWRCSNCKIISIQDQNWSDSNMCRIVSTSIPFCHIYDENTVVAQLWHKFYCQGQGTWYLSLRDVIILNNNNQSLVSKYCFHQQTTNDKSQSSEQKIQVEKWSRCENRYSH